jgi:MFS family permease
MSHPRPNAAAWATVAVISLARIGFGYQAQTVASLGPELRAAFDIEFAVLGTLMGLYLLPGIVVAIPAGFLARRFGDGAVILAGLGLMTLGSSLSALAQGPAIIGAGRVLAGMGAVAVTVLAPKAVADRFTGTPFTLAMGLLVSAFPIGIGLGQVSHHRLAMAFGWQAAFWAGAGLAAVCAALFLVTWKPVPGSTSRSLSWPSAAEFGLLVLAGLIWTTFNAGYQNFLGYLPSAMVARGHSNGTIDLVIGVATWGNLPTIILGGILARRFGAVRVFLLGASAEVVVVLGMGVVDWPLLWGLLFGTLASVHAGIMMGWGALSSRAENRAVGMGIFYTVYYIGGSVFPAICGRAADIAGDASGAFLAAGVLTALTIPFWWWHRRAGIRSGILPAA